MKKITTTNYKTEYEIQKRKSFEFCFFSDGHQASHEFLSAFSSDSLSFYLLYYIWALETIIIILYV